MTNSTKIDDRLDQPRPDVVGNTVKVEDHLGETSAVLLLPANQVPVLILGSLVMCGFRRGGCLWLRTRLDSRPRPGLGGRRARGAVGAVLEHLLLQGRGLSILLLALHGGIGTLDLGGGARAKG